jgi:hypothetical protein
MEVVFPGLPSDTIIPCYADTYVANTFILFLVCGAQPHPRTPAVSRLGTGLVGPEATRRMDHEE